MPHHIHVSHTSHIEAAGGMLGGWERGGGRDGRHELVHDDMRSVRISHLEQGNSRRSLALFLARFAAHNISAGPMWETVRLERKQSREIQRLTCCQQMSSSRVTGGEGARVGVGGGNSMRRCTVVCVCVVLFAALSSLPCCACALPTRYACVYDVTRLHVWHDSFICVT